MAQEQSRKSLNDVKAVTSTRDAFVVSLEQAKPNTQERKNLFIAALIEEGMSEEEAEERYVAQTVTVNYIFVAVTDDATCEDCLDYNGDTFSREEVDSAFPYAEEVDSDLIMPMVHPNCRCMLAML